MFLHHTLSCGGRLTAKRGGREEEEDVVEEEEEEESCWSWRRTNEPKESQSAALRFCCRKSHRTQWRRVQKPVDFSAEEK